MDFEILHQRRFIIEHSPSCTVPGYLIVSPLTPARTYLDLPRPARAELGQILEFASMAIKLTIAPIKLHCAHFGDESAPLRFHLFPRTQRVTHEFLGAYPGRPELLLRPLLLHWARGHYRAPPEAVWQTVSPYLPGLREAFLLAARARSPLA
jgi:diadenosine tetraphosphate (Ap4A) HIT family hydrolase